MEGADLLLTVAEIAAWLADFTGMIGALQGAPAVRNPDTRLVFWMMVEFSLAAIFFALAPFAVANFQVGEHLTSAPSSASIGVLLIVHSIVILPIVRPQVRAGLWPISHRVTVSILFTALSALQWMKVAVVVFEGTFAACFLGLMPILMVAAFHFVNLPTAVFQSAAAQQTERERLC